MFGRLSDRRPSGYRLGDVFDVKNDVENLTENSLKRILSPLVKDDFPMYVITAIGLQGTGKTYFCKYLAFKAWEYYGDKMKIIFTDSLKVALSELDDHTVYFIIIDDAAEHQSSKDGMSKDNKEIAKRWFRLRHEAMAKCCSATGRIIVVFNYQRWASVHPDFRNPQLLFALGPMADTKDANAIYYRVGQYAYAFLEAKQDKIESNDQEAKNESIVRIMSKPLPQGSGLFQSQYIPKDDPWSIEHWPEYLEERNYVFDEEITESDVLDELANNNKWQRKAEVYSRYASGEEDQQELAFSYGLSKGRISQIVKEVEEEIERRMKN